MPVRSRRLVTRWSGFNPRPPLLAGDARLPTSETEGRHRFNPRPPLLAGDAPMPSAFNLLCWRFNPRPPLLAGDAGDIVGYRTVTEVSIRARHCWRAMRGCAPSLPRQAKFQSAPAIAGGRCRQSLPRNTAPSSFNPRPPLLAGDASVGLRFRPRDEVSIRARHCWRAMRVVGLSETRHDLGFNPRPPLLAGDAQSLGDVRRQQAVSIRARHCWRAMPCAGAWRARRSCFNPRPPLLAGDARAG